MSQFNIRLQYLLDQKKISQLDVVNGTRFDSAQVSRWLTGKVVPRRSTLQDLADFFGCNINWLAEDKGKPFNKQERSDERGMQLSLERTQQLMRSLGGRITLLMSNKVSHEWLADSTGIDKSTIIDLSNNKETNTTSEIIQKLAGYFNCNPEWLENGEGDIYNEDLNHETAHHVPASKRLEYLKGDMSLEMFAKKCGVSSKDMEVYLKEGQISSYANVDVDKIAKAFNTSTGWLNSGEAWQSPERKFTGFSFEKHNELGKRLWDTHKLVEQLWLSCGSSYPLAGQLSMPKKAAYQCVQELHELRVCLEDNLFEDHPTKANPNVYFGERELDRFQIKEDKNTNILEHLVKFVEDTYDEETGAIDFLDDLKESSPQYKEWRDMKKRGEE